MSDALCHVNMRLLKQQQSLTCHTISDIFDSCNTRQAERRPFTLFRLKTLGQLPLPHEIQRRPTRVTSKLAEAPEPAGTTWYQVWKRDTEKILCAPTYLNSLYRHNQLLSSLGNLLLVSTSVFQYFSSKADYSCRPKQQSRSRVLDYDRNWNRTGAWNQFRSTKRAAKGVLLRSCTSPS